MPGAALTEPASVKSMLVHLGLPAEPPRVAPAEHREPRQSMGRALGFPIRYSPPRRPAAPPPAR
jgi:hypothetical protein